MASEGEHGVMTRRILIALTSHAALGDTGKGTGFYVSEAAHPWEVFTEAGFEVDLVSVAGGEPPRDGVDSDDPVQRRFLALPSLGDTPRPEDVDPSGYSAILFAGGHGTMWDFPDNPALAALTRTIWENGGVVAAVCHGPAALVGVTLSDGTPLVAGRRVAAFTDAEEAAVGLTTVVPFLLASRLRELGAEHVPGPDFQPQVIRDGRLVTGQNPASARGVAEAVLSALSSRAADSGTVPANLRDVTVRTSDGPMGGYLACPAGDGVYPAVIVAHQLFGLTEDVRAVADRIAGMGYVVLAPDYYHRADPGVELPPTDEGRARGFELIATLSRTGVLEDTRAAVDYLAARDDTSGAVGMVGLSLGGHLAYLAATQLGFPITVVLYGGWLTGTDIPVSSPEPTLDLTPGIKGKLVYIIGDRDHAIPEEQRTAIAERLRVDGIRHEMVVLAGAPHAYLSQEDSPYHAETWQRIERALADELA